MCVCVCVCVCIREGECGLVVRGSRRFHQELHTAAVTTDY